MDAVEIARQSAAALHDATVAAGHDPRDPYAFAVAAAGLRGIDVEKARPGAVTLDRSRATYAPADDLIVHENVGSPFEQAFLVAHEIGHAELGDGKAPPGVPAEPMDPARASEPSPEGFERIGYNRQQRREIQMDLFGRELLLPRHVVRKFHVVDGRMASAIADEFGMPFEVVAQQLLDALLLPIVPAKAQTEEGLPPPPLNARQRVAARRFSGPYLLAAGPGTGKTQTLTGRVSWLLDQKVDPRSILLLTFSNKAAVEMADRLARVDRDAAAAMQIGTFHSFGLDLIKRFVPSLRPRRLMDRAEAVELLEERFPAFDLKEYRNLYDPTRIVSEMLKAISRAKDEVVDELRYAELARDMAAAAASADAEKIAARAGEVAQVYAAYERLKADEGCLDFGDLVMRPVVLLENDEQVRDIMRKQCAHVLVDEYQDVNRASVRLLEALCGKGENLWAVGDARQSIYRFRGASSFNTSRFGKEDFEGGRRGRLQVNYRSTSEIVGAFSAFAEEMPTGGGSLSSSRGRSGAGPELRKVDSKEALPQKIAEAIEEMRRAGYSYGDQAVLCTGNEKLSDFARELELQGIPALYLGSLFERPEVKDLLSFLSVLCDPRGMGIVRLASVPCFAMSMPDVDAALSELRRSPCLPGEWDVWIDRSSMTERGRKGLAAVAAACAGFDAGSHPWTILASLLLDRSRLAAEMSEAGDVAGRTRGIAVWQLMNFLRVQPPGRGAPVPRLLERIKRLVRLRDDRDLRQLPASARTMDAVHLMTIHGAKGLEFPVVHVPGMNADTLPRPAQTPPCPPPDGMIEGADRGGIETLHAGHDEEQECLFYVAASRARDRLLLYAATQRSDGGARALSRFVDRLGEGLSRNHVQPVPKPAASVEDAVISLRVGGEMIFTGEQIGLYESCARRFFYTHVLRIGGRRTESPFMRMHEAVRVVVHGIVEGSIAPAPTALDGAMAVALEEAGLPDPDFRQYGVHARALLEFFVATRDGHRPETTDDVVLRIGADAIRVRADDLIMHSDGRRRFRRVKTGHRRSKEGTDIAAAILTLATRQAYPDAVAELVHLADGKVSEVGMKPTMLRNRQRSLEEALRHIRAGRFPTDPGTDTCPRCPAFFICGPVPEGQLSRNW
ncbi:UvrD-helicase domain-containing protein [Methylobacterium radiodurans]|uniref:DNA 3'-5' helicase n=1 Tax=Methylobacterium radiodurans TaxID=2202828 RepID=A0A2U8VP37_9HYPH|nr:UvrD-helicase domain-containing protein [Methylobacterium radiodurans]AWN35146.1 DNA helicase UvrD [Methylobacterium radiodurans]